MMTSLKKPIRRELCRTFEAGRPVIVTLSPGDLITFRPKGCHRGYTTTLQSCLLHAAKQAAEAKRREKLAGRKARKL